MTSLRVVGAFAAPFVAASLVAAAAVAQTPPESFDEEVVVRVDEASNTKLTFVRQSIQRVINGDAEDAPR